MWQVGVERVAAGDLLSLSSLCLDPPAPGLSGLQGVAQESLPQRSTLLRRSD